MKDYSLIYISKWQIKGFPHYAFLADKRLFNYKTNRFSKKVVMNYSVGFNLDGDFYTLKTLKDWITPIERSSRNNKKATVIDFNDLIIALAS